MSDRRKSPPILIYKGDDLAELGELHKAAVVAERKYQQAQQGGTSRMGDDESPEAAWGAYDARAAEAAERAEVVVVQALGRKQWRALLNEHPPRRVIRKIEGVDSEVVHDDDDGYGVNTETFSEALLTYTEGSGDDLEQTVIEPEFSSKEARIKWLDGLAGGDFDRLFLAAYQINGSLGGDPKLARYSSGIAI